MAIPGWEFIKSKIDPKPRAAASAPAKTETKTPAVQIPQEATAIPIATGKVEPVAAAQTDIDALTAIINQNVATQATLKTEAAAVITELQNTIAALNAALAVHTSLDITALQAAITQLGTGFTGIQGVLGAAPPDPTKTTTTPATS